FLDALVTLTLNEGARSETVELRFDPGDRRAKQVNIPSLSEQPPAVRIDTLVVRADGSTFAGQPFETSDPVVLVRDRDGAFRQLAVKGPAGPTRGGPGRMGVQVQVVDETGEPMDGVVFPEPQGTPAVMLVPSGADAPHTRYRIVRYGLNGTR